MAGYPAFPPAIRPSGVGCIRVTHPSATLAAPKGRLPFDLHVLGLPLAFILSQDQTLRCTIAFLLFALNLGFPPPGASLLYPERHFENITCQEQNGGEVYARERQVRHHLGEDDS